MTFDCDAARLKMKRKICILLGLVAVHPENDACIMMSGCSERGGYESNGGLLAERKPKLGAIIIDASRCAADRVSFATFDR